jgi:hypothetical protein
VDTFLRSQLRDVAREAVPGARWRDTVQGSELLVGRFRLSIMAYGSRDSWVSVSVVDTSEPGPSRSIPFGRGLRRGHGVETRQGGDISRPVWNEDPEAFLIESVRMARDFIEGQPAHEGVVTRSIRAVAGRLLANTKSEEE